MLTPSQEYYFDIFGVSSIKRGGFGIVDLDGELKLFYSGADPSMPAKSGVGILTSFQLSECVRLDTFRITGLYVEA